MKETTREKLFKALSTALNGSRQDSISELVFTEDTFYSQLLSDDEIALLKDVDNMLY